MLRRVLLLLALSLAACSRAPVVDGVGDRLQSFIVSTSSVTKPTCLVCANSGKPMLMAIGDPEDPGFGEDLAELKRLAGAHEGLAVFAIATKIADGKHVPFADEAAAYERMAALRRELGLEFPVALVPKDNAAYVEKGYRRFQDVYRLKGPRTLLFASRDGKIKWAEAMRDPAQRASLDAAISAAL